jgi:D-alanyl-D-alanine carboxypeptidase/D-alanyl-D-alanine-endopeptidase (penicillin-binding protein 4)
MNNVLMDNDVVINSDTFFENGSGLSRKSTISPEAVLSLLKAIKRHPYSEIILKSLPISGVDGTLENKYKSDLLTNRLKLKTGTLDGVRGLAGFITGLSGKEYAFVFLHNSISDHSSETATFTTDLLNWAVSNN